MWGETLLGSLGTLLLAFVLALPLAWQREMATHRLGLRTMPLVSVASCGYVLIGVTVADGDPVPLSRIIAGLITGIGFIGGGAILKSREEVLGSSTAAAVWATGAVGAAVATGRIELAIAIVALTFLTFLVLTPVRDKLQEDEKPNE